MTGGESVENVTRKHEKAVEMFEDGSFKLQKQTSKMHFVSFLYAPRIMIFWEFFGKENFIMTMPCRWVVHHPVGHLKRLQWVAQKHLNLAHLIHILDHYLMAASSYNQCCADLKNFLSFCEYLGVPIALEKLWVLKPL